METNGKNRFASQGVSIAQMMYASKYKSHKIALFNSMKKSNITPISRKWQFSHATCDCHPCAYALLSQKPTCVQKFRTPALATFRLQHRQNGDILECRFIISRACKKKNILASAPLHTQDTEIGLSAPV